MRPTRALWAVGLLAVVLTVLAVAFARPLLLLGSVLIGAWILIQQLRFLGRVDASVRSLTVTQLPERPLVRSGTSASVTLAVDAAEPLSLVASVTAGVPHTARLEDGAIAVSLAPGESTAERTDAVAWPVAGRHEFERAELVVSDGWFRATIPVGSTPTVTVEPHGPRGVHVGLGGEQVTATPGDHRGGQFGQEIEPAEIREYLPGDAANRIDWNATARLTTPHVRVYEGEMDRPTLLLLDSRPDLWRGPPGETPFEYLREAALEVVAAARETHDPVGLLTVNDGGITTHIAPASVVTTYTRIRRQLFSMQPPADVARRSSTSVAGFAGGSRGIDTTRPSSAQSRQALEHLADDETAFAASLRPFYDARRHHAERIETAPLVGALERTLRRHDQRLWTVLCTDDSEPATLWDAVRTIREHGQGALILLTPSVLFEPGGLADLERAYDRYVAFEDLRRDLDRLEGIRALEVAPGDRLAAVLAAGQARRARGGNQ